MNHLYSVQDIFNAKLNALSPKILAELESTEEFQQLKEQIQEQLPQASWEIIRGELLGQVEQLLDIDIQPILIESWKTHQDVQAIIQQQLDDPNQDTELLHLETHRIRSTHTPNLELQISNELTGHLRVFIGLTFEIRDVILKIQEGKIREIIRGTLMGEGFMQYQNVTLTEKEFLAIDIADEVPAKRTVTEHKNKVTPPQFIQQDNHSSTTKIATVDTTVTSPARSTLSTIKYNTLQFLLGVLLALIAVYLFWELK